MDHLLSKNFIERVLIKEVGKREARKLINSASYQCQYKVKYTQARIALALNLLEKILIQLPQKLASQAQGLFLPLPGQINKEPPIKWWFFCG
jgi:hypothetical protein